MEMRWRGGDLDDGGVGKVRVLVLGRRRMVRVRRFMVMVGRERGGWGWSVKGKRL